MRPMPNPGRPSDGDPTPPAASLRESRRAFLRESALATTLGLSLPWCTATRAAPQEPIGVGILGCGGHGILAALTALAANPAIRVTALADFSPRAIAAARAQLLTAGCDVLEDRCFTGTSACDALVAAPGLSYVVDATPPGFRPAHFRKLVQAGLSSLLVPPVAVDVPGARSVMESAAAARARRLAVLVDFPRRRQPHRAEVIRRIRDGELGTPIEARAYTLEPEPAGPPSPVDETTLEGQVRQWRHVLWLSGDHIVERHVHQLDIIHWLKGAPPVRAIGMGGRQTRRWGNNYDHFAVEYEWADGFRLFSYCRQSHGCEMRVGEELLASRGRSDLCCRVEPASGAPWATPVPDDPADVALTRTHFELATALLNADARRPEEASGAATSTLMAILGRSSAYTGKTLEWQQLLESTQGLAPAMDGGPLTLPPAPIPGRYSL